MNAEPERRQTPTERLQEVTMAALTRKPAEPESSVEVARNAKGAFQFSVTVRGVDAQACYEEAVRLSRLLTERYPYDEDNGTPGKTDADKLAAKAAAIARSSITRGGSS